MTAFTYQCAILDRYGRSCARSSIHLEAEFRCRLRGGGQSVPHREIHHALWIVALGHGDVGKAGGLIDGCAGADLVDLDQEPGPVLWLLQTQMSDVCLRALQCCLHVIHAK